ncbi:hypothetical protein KDJ56_00885 [Brevibacillus composti]|uniref:Uncharacterized protein n=1 Tax=Brevibacillus composti TaxID=2796470 RepID=A0A7T5JNZ2_9BACL|nr:hypothetical protein [Brevibacillus composti]QQE74596.1 hypothetical protein JD108_00885 [Brevibacillus composti]QUO41679.1 hypothetical protein KDJ56_00885 [Brevibacillus composti]
MKKQYFLFVFLILVAFLGGYLVPKKDNNPTLKFSVSQYRQLTEYHQDLREALLITSKKDKLDKLIYTYYKVRDAKSGLMHLSLIFADHNISLDQIDSRVSQMEIHLKDYILSEALNMSNSNLEKALENDIEVANLIVTKLNYKNFEQKDIASLRNSVKELSTLLR